MLVFDPGNEIPRHVIAAMAHAERSGARASAWSPRWDTAIGEDFASPLASALAVVGLSVETYEIPWKNFGLQLRSFALVRDASDESKVALTLAGFQQIRMNLWQWASEEAI